MKRDEELISESENHRELLEQARSWLVSFKARIDELEKKCDAYAAYVQTQDEQISKLQEQLYQKQLDFGKNAEVQDADLSQAEIENTKLRQRLTDLNEYLRITRRDGAKFYLWGCIFWGKSFSQYGNSNSLYNQFCFFYWTGDFVSVFLDLIYEDKQGCASL